MCTNRAYRPAPHRPDPPLFPEELQGKKPKKQERQSKEMEFLKEYAR